MLTRLATQIIITMVHARCAEIKVKKEQFHVFVQDHGQSAKILLEIRLLALFHSHFLFFFVTHFDSFVLPFRHSLLNSVENFCSIEYKNLK